MSTLSQTRDELLQRLSLAHKKIKRSRRASLIDSGQSFTENGNNIQRLNDVIIKHATARICRVIRSAVRASLHRRMQRSLYRLQCHAATASIAEKSHVIQLWKNEIHRMRHLSLRNRVHQLQSENNVLEQQRVSIEHAVANVQSRVVEHTIKEAKLVTLRRTYLRHALIRKFHLQQKQVLDRWYQHVQVIVLLQKMKSRWSRRKLRHWFQLWVDSEHALGRVRRALRNIYRRAAIHRVSHSFYSWQHRVSQIQKLRSLITAMKQSKEKKYFQQWKEYVLDKYTKQNQLTATWKKWSNRRLLKGMNTWCDYVVETKKFKKLNKIIKHFKNVIFNRKLHLCLSKWRKYVRDQQEIVRFKLSHCKQGLLLLSSIHSRGLKRFKKNSFLFWKIKIEKRLQQELQILKIQQNYSYKFKWKLFHSWYDAIQRDRRQRIAVTRYLRHWTNRHVRSVLLHWKNNVDVLKQQQQKMKNFIFSISKKVETKILRSWKHWIQNRKKMRLLLQRVFVIQKTSIRHYVLRCAFSTWSRCNQYMKELFYLEREQKEYLKTRNRILYLLVVNVLRLKYLRNAMNRWSKYYYGSISNDKIKKRVLMNWIHRFLQSMFNVRRVLFFFFNCLMSKQQKILVLFFFSVASFLFFLLFTDISFL